MRFFKPLTIAVLASTLSGCTVLGLAQLLCAGCDTPESGHQSSSLVDFLYPRDRRPPLRDSAPKLHPQLRIGLVLLETKGVPVLRDSYQQLLLERTRQRFLVRPFVGEIVLIPRSELRNQHRFESLREIQHRYGIDLIAIVSYDQALHVSHDNWTLEYVTIAGKSGLSGNINDVSALVELAVVDPATHSLVLRVKGTDVRHGTSTHNNVEVESSTAQIASISAAVDQMIGGLNLELDRLQSHGCCAAP